MNRQIIQVRFVLTCLLFQLFSLSGAAVAEGASGPVAPGSAGSTLDASCPEDLACDPQGPVEACELVLADLRYTSGVRVAFSYDIGLGEFGLLQEGLGDQGVPLVDGGPS